MATEIRLRRHPEGLARMQRLGFRSQQCSLVSNRVPKYGGVVERVEQGTQESNSGRREERERERVEEGGEEENWNRWGKRREGQWNTPLPDGSHTPKLFRLEISCPCKGSFPLSRRFVSQVSTPIKYPTFARNSILRLSSTLLLIQSMSSSIIIYFGIYMQRLFATQSKNTSSNLATQKIPRNKFFSH